MTLQLSLNDCMVFSSVSAVEFQTYRFLEILASIMLTQARGHITRITEIHLVIESAEHFVHEHVQVWACVWPSSVLLSLENGFAWISSSPWCKQEETKMNPMLSAQRIGLKFLLRSDCDHFEMLFLSLQISFFPSFYMPKAYSIL